MRYSLGFAALAALAAAAPTETEKNLAPRAVEACESAVTLAPGSNPFKGRNFFANDYYAGEIAAAIESMSDASLKAQAAQVAKVGSYLWM